MYDEKIVNSKKIVNILKKISATTLQICSNIKAARVSKEYSQQFIADKIGVGRSTYAEWEKNIVPDFDTLTKISEVTNVALADLISIPITGKTKVIEDTDDDNKISIRILSETNGKLVDGHLRLIALLEEDKKEKAKTRESESNQGYINEVSPIVVERVAQAILRSMFPNGVALPEGLSDEEIHAEHLRQVVQRSFQIDAENARLDDEQREIDNRAAEKGLSRVSKSRRSGKLHTQK